MIIKIDQICLANQIYFSCFELKMVIRDRRGCFILINFAKKQFETSNEKIRELDKSLTYSKDVILVSCLNYSNFIN